MNSSLTQDRKKWSYRLLEGLIGYASIGFLIGIIILTLISPPAAAVFLILYSFLWVMKFSLNAIYTIYTYKQVLRWEKVDWPQLFLLISNDVDAATLYLRELQTKFASKLDWQQKIETDINNLHLIQNTKFSKPNEMYHVTIFSVYNEPAEVIIRSLKCIYEACWDLSKILVVVSQEARLGDEINKATQAEVSKESWLKTNEFIESNLDITYSNNHTQLEYNNQTIAKLKLYTDKLNVIFTQHPDGLVGEIKGKASNEDWGGRHASLIVKAKKIDAEMVTVTSLDADSHIGVYFFHNLAYRYCLTLSRSRSGFQPVHVYSNNLFQTGFWQRQTATQNTLIQHEYAWGGRRNPLVRNL